MPAHDGAQGEHVGLGLAQRLVHARQRVEEYVHALVVVFIPPGNDEYPGIRRKLAPQEASRRAKEFGPRPDRNVPFGAVVGDDPHVEAAVMRLTVVKQSASRADAVSIEHLAVML